MSVLEMSISSFRKLLYITTAMSLGAAQGTFAAQQDLLEVFFQFCRRRNVS